MWTLLMQLQGESLHLLDADQPLYLLYLGLFYVDSDNRLVTSWAGPSLVFLFAQMQFGNYDFSSG